MFTCGRASINNHGDGRPGDPGVTHNGVLKVDAFGNVLQGISVAYGRNLNAAGVQLAPASQSGAPPDLKTNASAFAQPEQATSLITLTENIFTRVIDQPDTYRTPMPSETFAYELTRPTRPDDSAVYLFADLQSLADGAANISYEIVPG